MMNKLTKANGTKIFIQYPLLSRAMINLNSQSLSKEIIGTYQKHVLQVEQKTFLAFDSLALTITEQLGPGQNRSDG